MFGVTSVAVVTGSGAFVAGMTLALLGSLKLSLAKRLDMSEARLGGLHASMQVTLLPMMLLSGILLDSFGVRLVLIAGALLLALALASLGLRSTYTGAFVALLVCGAGLACVSTASVVLMPMAFFGEDQLTASVLLGHVFLALGALLTPPLIDSLLTALDFRRTLLLLALVTLVPAFVAVISFGASADSEFAFEQKVPLSEVLSNPKIWMIGLAFLLYLPLELGLSTWGTTYLVVDHGISEKSATRAITLFWLMFLAGRALLTFMMQVSWMGEAWAGWLILLLSLATAGILGNLAGAARPRDALLALAMLGLTMGPIFPLLVALALQPYPENRGTAYNAMYVFGSAGSMIFMPLLGVLARRWGVGKALRAMTPLVLVLVVLSLALAIR